VPRSACERATTSTDRLAFTANNTLQLSGIGAAVAVELLPVTHATRFEVRGGQATIPMVAAVSRVQPVRYGEIVATVASRSVGPGTRKNIDEFTRTTAGAVEQIGGAKKGKAIIVINPAEPALMMRDTVHCLTETTPDQAAITASIHQMIAEVQKYVPGYKLVNGPMFDGNRVSVYLEVEGLGDYLPKFAGNLDIMTAAAARTAEMFAENILSGAIQLEAVTA
jgi:acetaldehyde/propanal dehydrogenase